MSKLEILTLYGFVIGLASQVFMAYVFYSESFLGRGILYIEPNRPFAFGELVACVFGMICLAFVTVAMFSGMRSKSSSDTEPTGYPKSDRAYA